MYFSLGLHKNPISISYLLGKQSCHYLKQQLEIFKQNSQIMLD